MQYISTGKRLAALVVVGIFIAIGSQAQSFLTNGLVAYYHFDGNTLDSSGNSLNGTLYNAGFVADEFGEGLNTTGSINSYDEIAPSPLLDTSNAVSIAMWFKVYGYPNSDNGLIYKAAAVPTSSGFTDRAYFLSFKPDGHFEMASTANGASSQTICFTPTGLIQTDQFYHIVAIVNSPQQSMSIYLNGALVGTGIFPATGIITGEYPLRIGGIFETLGDQCGLDGVINELRIYNRALLPSEVAQLYAFAPQVPTISIEPQSSTNNIGDYVSFNVSSANSVALNYQWYFDGNPINNATNSVLSIANVRQVNMGNYFVVVSDLSGSVTSSIATIYEPATIVSQPANLVVPLQAPATFSVTAVGFPAPSYYQWSLNGTNLTGANSNSLTISSVKMNNTGNYQVLVSNSISSTNSAIATLDLSPSITSPFIGATPIWGRNTTLSVGAVGNGTLTYQWYVNGQPISGAVYPQLDFTSIQLTNSGFYSVVISSPYGSITNTAYQVAVQPSVVTLGFYPGLTINGAAGNSYLIQRSANLSNTNNWQTLSSLTMYQPIELWIDTSVDATSPFNNGYFYQLIPQ